MFEQGKHKKLKDKTPPSTPKSNEDEDFGGQSESELDVLDDEGFLDHYTTEVPDSRARKADVSATQATDTDKQGDQPLFASPPTQSHSDRTGKFKVYTALCHPITFNCEITENQFSE